MEIDQRLTGSKEDLPTDITVQAAASSYSVRIYATKNSYRQKFLDFALIGQGVLEAAVEKLLQIVNDRLMTELLT